MLVINSYNSAVEIDFCINFSDHFINSENLFYFEYKKKWERPSQFFSDLKISLS